MALPLPRKDYPLHTTSDFVPFPSSKTSDDFQLPPDVSGEAHPITTEETALSAAQRDHKALAPAEAEILDPTPLGRDTLKTCSLVDGQPFSESSAHILPTNKQLSKQSSLGNAPDVVPGAPPCLSVDNLRQMTPPFDSSLDPLSASSQDLISALAPLYVSYRQRIPTLTAISTPDEEVLTETDDTEVIEYVMSKHQHQLTLEEGKLWDQLSGLTLPSTEESTTESKHPSEDADVRRLQNDLASYGCAVRGLHWRI